MKTLTEHVTGLENKTILVRCNFDVPLENGVVGDTTRLEDAIPTLKLLREHHCRIIMLAHAGRPDGKYSKEDSLEPMIPLLEGYMGEPIALAPFSWDITQFSIPDAPIVLFENMRFWTGEEENDPAFAKALANLAEAYVNEAFANCHRKHASIVGLPKLLPSYAGLSLAKELEILDQVTKRPQKPLVIVIGGAKLETKEPLVTAFKDTADAILVGGKLALDFKAKGTKLPTNVHLANLVESGKDITKESAEEFAKTINDAGTVIWNGTLGLFEEEEYQLGTKIVAEAINQTKAFTLVGGGDTEAALTELNLQQGIDHISTGGGAMLTFLSEGSLVGVEALQ